MWCLVKLTDTGKTDGGGNTEKKSKVCYGHVKMKCLLDIYLELLSVQLHIGSAIQGLDI